ncbi:MAG: hypothetical protein ACYDDA_14200 [Acidiferrobacteraceae bacterium]
MIGDLCHAAIGIGNAGVMARLYDVGGAKTSTGMDEHPARESAHVVGLRIGGLFRRIPRTFRSVMPGVSSSRPRNTDTHVLIALLFMSIPLALAAALRQKPSAVAPMAGTSNVSLRNG